MTERYVINPVTKRSLLVGGKTYFNLVNQGVLPYDPTVRHPRELYHIRPEDTVEKIERLKQELKTPEYFAVQGRGPRLENKLMIKTKPIPYGKKEHKPKQFKPTFVVTKEECFEKLHGATSSESSDDESSSSDSSVDWQSEIKF